MKEDKRKGFIVFSIMDNDINKLKVWQKIGIACLIIVISGFVGWLVEFMFYYIDHGKLHWKGGNFLPWINIYSVGSFLILELTHKHWKKPLNVFIISDNFISLGKTKYTKTIPPIPIQSKLRRQI